MMLQDSPVAGWFYFNTGTGAASWTFVGWYYNRRCTMEIELFMVTTASGTL